MPCDDIEIEAKNQVKSLSSSNKKTNKTLIGIQVLSRSHTKRGKIFSFKTQVAKMATILKSKITKLYY